MNRKVVIVLIVLALIGALIAFAVWFASQSNATGAVVEQARAMGANDREFRTGRDVQRARILERNMVNELAAARMSNQPDVARRLEGQLAALNALYPPSPSRYQART